jgi:methyl-accepting chemotaxis protein
MIGTYNDGLVALSVLLAIFASYSALDLAGRTRAAHGLRRWIWLSGGAAAMGLGIWAMHYIGMLAFHLPVPVLYDVPTVSVSLLAAIAASAVALFVVSRNRLTVLSVAAGSIVMGSGIAAMHYTGMAAMRLPAMHHYHTGLVTLSVALAIIISMVALILTFLSRDDLRVSSWRKLGSALLMGVAVPVMHYTGMAAASFTAAPAVGDISRAVSISSVGVVGISSVTLMVLAFAILTSIIDRRFSSQTLELESSERRYREFLSRLVGILNVMRTGDLSGRLRSERDDEFGMVAKGFNRMTDELAGLVGEVQQSGVQVNAAVAQLAATAREQRVTASEIAATTREIGATSRTISTTSQQLVGTVNDVATVAEQSAALAGQGRNGLTHLEETMRRVTAAAASINAKLGVLNEKAGNISRVVTTITKVADQTNLLSLNAAIEAEKAGEYGHGFAVVATEIRRLADQTAVSTHDIERIVKEIQSAVAAGVIGMDKFSEELRLGMQDMQQVGGQLSQVIQQVQDLAPRMESVNEGMRAQATSAEQITEALTQLSAAAQQTVDSLLQSSLATDELNRVALGLRGGVSRFTLQAA